MGTAPARGGVRVRCPAKINLGLWVLGLRPDGYHEVDTFLQAVGLEDDLVLERGTGEFSLETRGRPIPGPGPNILERAWALLEETGALPHGSGLRARLTKRIPVGAGLGGGSSDAAGLIVGADRLFGLGLGPEALRALAVRLGSDVPFFLKGGLARARGRGDQVRHLCPMHPAWVLLASPPVAVSTGWAYGVLKLPLTGVADGARVLATAIEKGEWGGVARAMHNSFEEVILPRVPETRVLRRAIAGSGAIGALLSGSGSTVFGIIPTRREALAAAHAVRGCRAEIRVARTMERGVIVSRLA